MGIALHLSPVPERGHQATDGRTLVYGAGIGALPLLPPPLPPSKAIPPYPPRPNASERPKPAPASADGVGLAPPQGGDVRNNRGEFSDLENKRNSRGARRELYALRDWYRARAVGDRVRSCGRVRYDPETVRAAVHEKPDGKRSAGLGGVRLCESPWACTACGGALRKQRARAFRHLGTIAKAEHLGTHMATFTIRHKMGDPLRAMREGMREALQALQQSRFWSDHLAVGHDMDHIRALEVTYGEHGWHVHYHVMMVVDRPLTRDEVVQYQARLGALWCRKVELKLGAHHMPNMEHACRITNESPLDYASKLDMELSDPADAKRTHGAKPWDLLRAAKDGVSLFTGIDGEFEIKPARALQLMNEYERDMKGARLHTASRHLIWLLEDAVKDGVFASSFAGAKSTGDAMVAELCIPATLFDALRDIPGALVGLLEDCEESDATDKMRERMRELMRSRALALAWSARVVKWRTTHGEQSSDFGFPVNPLRDIAAMRWVEPWRIPYALGPVVTVLFPPGIAGVVEESQISLDFP